MNVRHTSFNLLKMNHHFRCVGTQSYNYKFPFFSKFLITVMMYLLIKFSCISSILDYRISVEEWKYTQYRSQIYWLITIHVVKPGQHGHSLTRSPGYDGQFVQPTVTKDWYYLKCIFGNYLLQPCLLPNFSFSPK